MSHLFAGILIFVIVLAILVADSIEQRNASRDFDAYHARATGNVSLYLLVTNPFAK
jgi:hypothetical protein